MSTKEHTMNGQPALPRLGAACGAIFAIVLTVANGNGNHAFSGARAVAGIAALTLVLPFFAYLCSLLRQAEGTHGWLSSTALAAGITGITLKLTSGVPELAMQRAHVADGTALHKTLDALAGGATVLCLYPLAVFCAATAIVALRTHVLPRWLGVGAAITAAALAINGCFLNADTVPALLLFALWTLLTSIALLRTTRQAPANATPADAPATA
jgi:hypothetical protein